MILSDIIAMFTADVRVWVRRGVDGPLVYDGPMGEVGIIAPWLDVVSVRPMGEGWIEVTLKSSPIGAL